MKDLTTYINEGIFDEEENLKDLDWYSVTLETLRNAKTEKEFNKYFDILEMCVKNCASRAPEGPDHYIAKEQGKRYISFCPGRRKSGLSRELFYGTYSTAYVIEWGTDRRNGIYTPQVINTKFHAPFSKLNPTTFLPHYLPKYLDKSFKLMSRDAR
jgi:hypothetical protein